MLEAADRKDSSCFGSFGCCSGNCSGCSVGTCPIPAY